MACMYYNQLDFLLKGGELGIVMICEKKKHCVRMRILNLFQDLFISFLKVLVGVQTKDKPAVITDDPSSVNL